MKVRFVLPSFLLSATLLVASNLVAQSPSAAPAAAPRPPVAVVRPVVDDYFGTKVTDPYRSMENLKDPEVQAWFKGQNDFARAELAQIPGRDKLLARIRELDQSVPAVGAYRRPGDTYMIYKLLPGEDAEKLYLRHGLDGNDRLLVDPRKIQLTPENQAKGKNAIADAWFSDDGRLMTVGITPGGSESNTEIRVIEVATGRETGDVISRHVGDESWQPSWLPGGRAFVYGRTQDLPPGAPETEGRKKFRAYLHVIGTDTATDKPVFGNGVVPSIEVDPSLIAYIAIPPGSRYAFGVLSGSVTRNRAYYIAPVDSIGKPNTPWRKIADFAGGVTGFAVQGDDLYLLTYKDAPRYKILLLDARNPDLATAETVLPQGEGVTTNVRSAQDALYVSTMDAGITHILRLPYGPAPKPEPIALPFEGSGSMGTDPRLPGALLYVSTWTRAFSIYAYDPKTKQVTDTHIQPAGPYDAPPDLESVEVKVPSYDGTLVPLSIVYKKGLKLDGSNPTLLYGYASYGNIERPYFVPKQLAWYELGGVNAVCHGRGGGEYGEAWHLAGKQATKPNTWRDFIACAQYLVDKKYTSPSRLAGEGVSAGGILIGRAVTERPDLFGAAIMSVGALDMLRFETSENGATNIPEFGTTKTEPGFKALYEMSAYEHVKQGTAYPAVLLTTGINDPRVPPWVVGKMAARLQADTSSGKPILLRVNYGGGHFINGGGVSEGQQAEADKASFLLWQFGVAGFQPHP